MSCCPFMIVLRSALAVFSQGLPLVREFRWVLGSSAQHSVHLLRPCVRRLASRVPWFPVVFAAFGSFGSDASGLLLFDCAWLCVWFFTSSLLGTTVLVPSWWLAFAEPFLLFIGAGMPR